jgi:hypothetical protein
MFVVVPAGNVSYSAVMFTRSANQAHAAYPLPCTVFDGQEGDVIA